MAIGRPKKPNHIKELEGDRGKRGIDHNTPTPQGAPVCPKYIKGYAAEVWNRVIDSMPPQLYAACDTQLLAVFCSAAKLHRQATESLDTVEDVADIKKWASIQNQAATVMVSTGGKLGLDPSSRASLSLPKPQEKASKFSGLVQIAGGRSGS